MCVCIHTNTHTQHFLYDYLLNLVFVFISTGKRIKWPVPNNKRNIFCMYKVHVIILLFYILFYKRCFLYWCFCRIDALAIDDQRTLSLCGCSPYFSLVLFLLSFSFQIFYFGWPCSSFVTRFQPFLDHESR